MSEISVDEYVENRKQELERFRVNWKRLEQEQPDEYPSMMEDGDWFEQETASYDLGFMEAE